jgi:predicted NUDIX family NTP pyrophosphohydrolase
MPSKATSSAGILLYRQRQGKLEVLLVHPGGPFWQRRDEGSWSIPKGERGAAEDGLTVARREFEEELGKPPPQATFIPLGSVRQAGGKAVDAWAAEGEVDVDTVKSNTFELEWPPRSGRIQLFPEIDRAGWFAVEQARQKLNPAQQAFVERLVELLSDAIPS